MKKKQSVFEIMSGFEQKMSKLTLRQCELMQDVAFRRIEEQLAVFDEYENIDDEKKTLVESTRDNLLELLNNSEHLANFYDEMLSRCGVEDECRIYVRHIARLESDINAIKTALGKLNSYSC